MKCRVLIQCAAVAAAAIVAAACGSGSPTSASGGGVAVQGVVMGDEASASAADTRSPVSSQARKLTVRVDGTSMTVDVSANGTFQLNGIPSGSFTLVFLADGVEVGRVQLSASDGAQVKVVVQVKASQLIVLEIDVSGDVTDPNQPPATTSCNVNGGTVGKGIELEGAVSSGAFPSFQMSVNGRSGFPIDVSASSASVSCIGGAKTTSDAECKASIKTGAKVHVSGTLLSCTTSSAKVTATAVKVQKD
jgi:hypothetical protein